MPKPADTVMACANRRRYRGQHANRNDRTQRMFVFRCSSHYDAIGRRVVGSNERDNLGCRKARQIARQEDDRLKAICQMMEARFDAAQGTGPRVQVGNRSSPKLYVGLWIVGRKDHLMDSGKHKFADKVFDQRNIPSTDQ